MPTPGLARSAHAWMFLGLPLRTTIDDDGRRQDALVGVLVPVLVDQPLVDESGDVGAARSGRVGLETADDGPALVARGAVRLLPGDALAGVGLGECLLERAVGGLGHGVGHEREGLLVAGRGRGVGRRRGTRREDRHARRDRDSGHQVPAGDLHRPASSVEGTPSCVLRLQTRGAGKPSLSRSHDARRVPSCRDDEVTRALHSATTPPRAPVRQRQGGGRRVPRGTAWRRTASGRSRSRTR